jgi:hypothetical protein
MLVTIQNLTAAAIQVLDAIDNRYTGGPADLYATGGNVVEPLPFPFEQVGELAAFGAVGDSVQRAMHPSDFRRQHNLHKPLEPREEWNQVIQAGTVSFAIAAEVGRRDTEELFTNSV